MTAFLKVKLAQGQTNRDHDENEQLGTHISGAFFATPSRSAGASDCSIVGVIDSWYMLRSSCPVFIRWSKHPAQCLSATSLVG